MTGAGISLPDFVALQQTRLNILILGVRKQKYQTCLTSTLLCNIYNSQNFGHTSKLARITAKIGYVEPSHYFKMYNKSIIVFKTVFFFIMFLNE